jgi:signal transduction histidine kinase
VQEFPCEIGLNPVELGGGGASTSASSGSGGSPGGAGIGSGGGDERYVIASITDVTERRRVEALRREKEAAQAELRVAQDAITARGDFLAMSSHELRTPLTGA